MVYFSEMQKENILAGVLDVCMYVCVSSVGRLVVSSVIRVQQGSADGVITLIFQLGSSDAN